MMRRNTAWQNLYTVFLYGFFALFSLVLVLLGVKVYRHIVTESEQIGQARTAFLYIQHKLEGKRTNVRAQDDMLVIEDEKMRNYIFEQDGMLYEAYAALDREPGALQKEPVAEVTDFRVGQYEDLIRISFQDEQGNRKEIYTTGRGTRP